MRKQFVKSLIKLAKSDKSIILLTADLGFNVLEPFQKEFPDRYINVGCIEQTMLGMSAGLAKMGMKPYVYSNSCFLIYRALEQLRNDICYPNYNVKLIGTQGTQYNFLGISHNIGKDDVKILKLLPNIEIYTPKTIKEVDKVISVSYNNRKPTYVRL